MVIFRRQHFHIIGSSGEHAGETYAEIQGKRLIQSHVSILSEPLPTYFHSSIVDKYNELPWLAEIGLDEDGEILLSCTLPLFVNLITNVALYTF